MIRKYWMPLVWTAIILILCLMPKSAEPEASWLTKIPHFDKIIHWGLYAGLAFFFFISNFKNNGIKFGIFVISYAILLGGVIEIIQPFVGRSNEWADLFADIFGCMCGIIAFQLIGNWFLKFIGSRK